MSPQIKTIRMKGLGVIFSNVKAIFDISDYKNDIRSLKHF